MHTVGQWVLLAEHGSTHLPPGWMMADPVCSMAITVLIVASVYPLMKDSLGTLMMRTPPTVEHYLPGAYQKVRQHC